MKIIGLTGGIGSGKSTILELFKFLGVKTYSADESAKKLVNTDPYLINLIKSSFGDNIYDKGILNSRKLSKIVFEDTEKLKLLNSIIHPAVAKDFKLFLNSGNGFFPASAILPANIDIITLVFLSIFFKIF